LQCQRCVVSHDQDLPINSTVDATATNAGYVERRCRARNNGDAADEDNGTSRSRRSLVRVKHSLTSRVGADSVTNADHVHEWRAKYHGPTGLRWISRRLDEWEIEVDHLNGHRHQSYAIVYLSLARVHSHIMSFCLLLGFSVSQVFLLRPCLVSLSREASHSIQQCLPHHPQQTRSLLLTLSLSLIRCHLLLQSLRLHLRRVYRIWCGRIDEWSNSRAKFSRFDTQRIGEIKDLRFDVIA